jgi:hypothetical protein
MIGTGGIDIGLYRRTGFGIGLSANSGSHAISDVVFQKPHNSVESSALCTHF